MTKAQRLENRIRQKPTRNDIRFEELAKFLKHYGFEMRAPSRGSHRVFYHPLYSDSGILSIPVPHGTACGVKQAYIRLAIAAVDELKELMEEN